MYAVVSPSTAMRYSWSEHLTGMANATTVLAQVFYETLSNRFLVVISNRALTYSD